MIEMLFNTNNFKINIFTLNMFSKAYDVNLLVNRVTKYIVWTIYIKSYY